jgi:hypothetical protein
MTDNRSLRLVWFSLAVYLVVLGTLFLCIRVKTGGHFTYALDDPYIHLALAENLAHGHYGINPGEYTSPSSSILWPLLLVPFAGTAFHAYLPLVWNTIFGALSACLIGYTISRWPPQTDQSGRMEWWKQAVTAIFLIVIANLVSLTLCGMEHVLQILLAIGCALGMIRVLTGERMSGWCVAAAVIAPMVRYEDLTLTVAVSLALAGLRQSRKALAVLGLSIIPLIAFSLFLHRHGLPLLPMSVLVKGNAYAKSGFAMSAFKQLRMNVYLDLTNPEHYALVILTLTFLGLTWRERDRVRRFIFGGAALLGVLHLLIGRFGWFGRYEVYALIFLTLLCLYVLGERPRFLFGYFVLGLLLCASPFLQTTEQTVNAAVDTYRNQYQMHRFVTEFYPGDYAVNDLGLVSFQRRPGAYVLDVFGLASPEASRQAVKNAEWLQGITARHGVKLAMLYPEWFQIPSSWSPIAKMCQPRIPVVSPIQCVLFYATTPDAAPEIRADLTRFAATLPKDVPMIFDPDPKLGGSLPAVKP